MCEIDGIWRNVMYGENVIYDLASAGWRETMGAAKMDNCIVTPPNHGAIG
jgi:hypothetical protein